MILVSIPSLNIEVVKHTINGTSCPSLTDLDRAGSFTIDGSFARVTENSRSRKSVEASSNSSKRQANPSKNCDHSIKWASKYIKQCTQQVNA